ncbi:glycosyl hydrolase family 18 protein [Schinkia sp. CFF1]
MFKNYRLVPDGDGYTVILYLDEQTSEFANELGSAEPSEQTRANEKITAFVKKNFSNLKVKSVKIMVGTTLLLTIPLNAAPSSAHEVNFNMSYLYFGNTQSFIKQVENTKGNINVTSPSYFDLNPDGSLHLTMDQAFVKEMHKQNKKVVPFLSNHWDRTKGRKALENREQLAQEIADVIIRYDLDGINVDIENVTEADRDNYTDFVRLLREKIPKDKEVSVAVAANPSGWVKGWHGSYDYKALAEHADYLMIMAYDEHYESGSEGPVASYNWVEKSIQYALKQGVPSEQIVLGLPFFGRYWIEGESYGGLGIANNRIDELVKKYNGTVTFDEKAKSPLAIITITEDDPVTTIAGRALKPGTYHIWFENNESLARKIDLVHQYNLKGTGSWALGQEDPSIWYNFNSYTKNHDYQLQAPQAPQVTEQKQTDTIKNNTQTYPNNPYHDITNHWAKDDIISIYNKGWMRGVKTNTFAPDKSLTRAEAAAILVRALDLKPLQPMTQPFGDVEQNHWANYDIIVANQQGLMKGKEKGRFAPDDKVTREEMAAILDRVIGVSPALVSEATNFKDVKSSRWSYEAIQNMNKQGIFGGFNDQTFRPTDGMTRAQMASILNRTAPLLGKDQTVILKVGSEGPEVKSLQSDLSFLGYFHESETGYFGNPTEEAVQAFQRDYALTVDGIVGPKTLNKIKEEVDKKNQEQ